MVRVGTMDWTAGGSGARRGLAGVALCFVALGLFGCGAGDDARSDLAGEACPAGPGFAERWPDRMGGGPTDGPVTVAVGRNPNATGLPVSPDPDGRYLMTKVLIGVSAPAGAPLEIRGAERTTGEPIGFTHLARDRGEGEAVGPGPAAGTVPDRGQGARGVADLPGYVLVEEAGCYRFTVAVDDRVSGPFYLRLG